MPIQILMPALSPTMTEGNLAKWHKKPGDSVKAGEVIAEIETDKATMEVEAVDEGKIGKILVPEGTQAVKVNAPIAVLLEEGETEADIKDVAAVAPAAAPVQQVKTETKAAAPAQATASAQTATIVAMPMNQGRVMASPLARRVAEQRGVDLRSVAGSGPNGRIVRSDVENARTGGAPSSYNAPQSSIDAMSLANALGQKYIAVPNTQIRKIIAKRLTESKQTVPHFYLTSACRIDKLMDMRAQLNSIEGNKISVNDLIIKAVAKAMVQVPAANASWTDDAILQYEAVDISVAVSTPNGLVTPIVKNAIGKSISEISTEMKELAARARDNKLRPEEFQGGGFTISNMGMYGITQFSAIINPPQSCILAVSAGEKVPVVNGDKIEIGTVMNVTLSVDHRAVDGAVGAEFMKALKGLIENPLTMLV